MPLFPYTCESCEHEFEKLVSLNNSTAIECPSCGGEKTVRGFGMPQAGKNIPALTNCRGDGPPCGAAMCGRQTR